MRRQVFYIPGFDPFPPRRYRELYRREAAAQSALSGHRIAIAGAGPTGWTVSATVAGTDGTVETHVEVLVWSDIVQTSMSHGVAATYVQLVRTIRAYVGSGAIFRIMRLRKGPALAALYPIMALVLQLILAVAAGVSLGALIATASRTGAALVGILAIAGVLHLFRRADDRLYAYYLMHDYAFTAREGGAMPSALKPRMAAFADRIAEALTVGWDEVLVVGHSSGAHLAVSALSDVIRAGRGPTQGVRPALSLLTLGHVVPMVSFLPGAADLRADLAFLSARDELTWVDVTAPGDGCAFALCDPVAVSGVAPPGKRWPLVISAAFTRTLAPATWRALRWRFFRLHFQYLCAFDALPGRSDDYDYFAVTAGNLTLGRRFAARPPSKMRIERPMSRHTSRRVAS